MFTLKWKISKGMWERDKHNGKGGENFENLFENNCKGFAFSCRGIKENPMRGGVM